MSARIEDTLQQLTMAAASAPSFQQDDGQCTSHVRQPFVQQNYEQQQTLHVQPETPAALYNPACLAATFSLLDDEQSLARCAAVCTLWHSVLESDDVWRRVYLLSAPPPCPYERCSSYKQQFQRRRALLNPPELKTTALKGSALCYNVMTRQLVSYNNRQRLLSVMDLEEQIRSEVVPDVDGSAGTADQPLLASTDSALVVLAAADGALQVWDVQRLVHLGVLSGHSSFVTSLCCSGHLAASCCSRQMRLWHVEQQQCLVAVDLGLSLPSPVLEPHLALCHQQQLLALANCAAPAPCPLVKVYSTQPAPSSRHAPNTAQHTSSSSSNANLPHASSNDATAAAAVAAAEGTGIVVGSSSCPGVAGAVLLRELAVTSASDMKLDHGLLLVASCFRGRAGTTNKNERVFTVVINIWDCHTWQLTRLVTPRLWTDVPMYSVLGTPHICITQGVVLCSTLRPASSSVSPTFTIHALQLDPALTQSGVRYSSDDSNSGGRHAGSSTAASSSTSSRRGPGDGLSGMGTGATAHGRVAVATAGGGGLVGVSASNTVMLTVSDGEDRSTWCGRVPLVEDTGGRVTVLLTTPTHLLVATEGGNIRSSELLPAAARKSMWQQQQQRSGGLLPKGAVAGGAEAEGGDRCAGQVNGGPEEPVVHVLARDAAGERFVALDV